MSYWQRQTEDSDEDSRYSGVAPADVLPGSRLRPSQFIAQVASRAAVALSSLGEDFQVQWRSRLVKFWSGNDPSIHYEVWVHEREARLEIGFHMEADEAHNAELYRELDKCLLDIQLELGNSVWLEPWDKGWVRLYETQPLWPLDTIRVEDTVARVVEFIHAVQPVYESILEELAS